MEQARSVARALATDAYTAQTLFQANRDAAEVEMHDATIGVRQSDKSSTQRPGGRNGILDGVRAVAVGLVILGHSTVRTFVTGGAIGVDVFFVLSGFLITTLLVREYDRVGTVSLRRFYARRTLRIWPALYVFVAAVLTWAIFFADHVRRAAVYSGVPWVATFTSNITAARDKPVFYAMGHTWSLGVEEQFYIAWPCLLLVLLGVAKTQRRVFIATAALVAVAAVALIVAEMHGVSDRRLFNGPDMRAEELLAGALGGMWLVWWPPQMPRLLGTVLIVSWLMVLSLIALTTGPGHRHYFLLQPLVALTTTAALLTATSNSPPIILTRTLGTSPVRWIGQISYSIYLWHVPVILYVNRWNRVGDHLRNVELLVVAVAGTLAISSASFYVVEQPFLRLKDRWFRNRAGSVAATG